MTVVTRFAPSPTGYLHIGGARTALFNWLLARKRGGRFVLRIEDTDRRRSTEESTRRILEDLQWLGLDWDEGPEVGGPQGPYFQSQRLAIYQKYVDHLIGSGHAYRSFEAPENQEKTGKGPSRREEMEPIRESEASHEASVVRFRMGGEDITVNDLILGEVTVKAEELQDFVIQKSDGYPTYHLAVVVDDYLMGVTHVLRGQEHLINTPRHMALQRALGFPPPTYAHLPLIFNMDGSKMSKRDKEKAQKQGLPIPEIDVHDFRVAGYLPEALLNFVALLGWSPGGDREFMTIDEMTALFSLERIGKTNARFDRDKLRAFNAEYIRSAPRDRLRTVLRQFLDATDYPLKNADEDLLDRLCDLYQVRSKTLTDMAENCTFFFADRIEYDPKAVQKVLAKEGVTKILIDLRNRLAAVGPWTAGAIHECIEKYAMEKQLGLGKVAQPIRVAVCGSAVSPPIDQTLEVLGKEKTLDRLQKTSEKLQGSTP